MRIKADLGEVNLGWSNASVVLKQFANGKETRRVTIEVFEPYMLEYLREQLDKIEANWKKRLGVGS
jgi:hypothetical protein